jgi:hypothetical protein
MNQQLERLLKAWEAFIEAEGGREATLRMNDYHAFVVEVAEQTHTDPNQLHQAILRRYPVWKRANQKKFPTVPPQA